MDSGYRYFGIRVRGKIVGMYKARFRGDGCFGEHQSIHPDYRGRGLARLMYEQLFRFARRNNCKRVYVNILASQLSTRKFVESLGAGRAQVFFRIIVPLGSHGIAVAACLSFLFSYIEYLGALVPSRGSVVTITLFTSGLILSWQRQFWNEFGAMCILSMIPIIIFYAIAGKFLVRGLAMGAIKG